MGDKEYHAVEQLVNGETMHFFGNSPPTNFIFVDKVDDPHSPDSPVKAILGDVYASLSQYATSPEVYKSTASYNLSVRLDFYKPKDGSTAAKYFAIGAEAGKRFPWDEILLVSPESGRANSSNSKIQIRAKVKGLLRVIQNRDPKIAKWADKFPVRVYRMFLNEIGDDKGIYENAFTRMFGSAPKDAKGEVREPEGREYELDRIKEIKGDDAVFISSVIDVKGDSILDPASNPIPSFAAQDSDAYFAQGAKEEADGWGFSEAMKRHHWVSAGLAHPLPKEYASDGKYREPKYKLALFLEDVLSIRPQGDFESVTDSTVIKTIEKDLPECNSDKLKNVGACKVIGRPTANGAFFVSTGVQKLVVTARSRAVDGDTSWRFAGIRHVVDGSMDQCLIRAPAHVFLFSGHGTQTDNWVTGLLSVNAPANTVLPSLANTHFSQFPTASADVDAGLFVTPSRPAPWPERIIQSTRPSNRIDLAEKWVPSELKMQWLIVVGCDSLLPGDTNLSMFSRSQSPCGKWANLAIGNLGLKGILGFSRPGFTSYTFLGRFVDNAVTKAGGIAGEWNDVWRDTEALSYTWRETNEAHGPTPYYEYDILKKGPAYVVRTANLVEKLVPESTSAAVGGPALTFKEPACLKSDGSLRNGSKTASGQLAP